MCPYLLVELFNPLTGGSGRHQGFLQTIVAQRLPHAIAAKQHGIARCSDPPGTPAPVRFALQAYTTNTRSQTAAYE